MPRKQKFIGPMTKHAAEMIAKSAAKYKAKLKHKKKNKKPQGRRVRALQVANHMARSRAQTQLPIFGLAADGKTNAGATAVMGVWPATYIRQSRAPHLKNGMRVSFCVPWKRYGIAGTSATIGSGSLTSYAGVSFAQTLALGCGIDLDTPGYQPSSYEYFWLNSSIAAIAANYSRYRPVGKFHFITVPSNATTASARSYWLSVSTDPMRYEESYTASVQNLMNQDDTIIHAAWQNRTLSVDFSDFKDWLYVNTSKSDSSTLATPADVRQRAFCSVSGLADYTNGNSNPIYDGYIFIKGTYDLEQWAPDLNPAQALSLMQRNYQRLKIEEVKDDESFAEVKESKTAPRSPTPSREPRALSASRKIPQVGKVPKVGGVAPGVVDYIIYDRFLNKQKAGSLGQYLHFQFTDNIKNPMTQWRDPSLNPGPFRYMYAIRNGTSTPDWWSAPGSAYVTADFATNPQFYIQDFNFATVEASCNPQFRAHNPTLLDGNSFDISCNPLISGIGHAYYAGLDDVFRVAQFATLMSSKQLPIADLPF